MTAAPAAPAARVFDALVEPAAGLSFRDGGVEWRRPDRERSLPWRHGTAAEALEALVAAGLVPPRWADPDAAPRWVGVVGMRRGEPRLGDLLAPPGRAELAAVASLGRRALDLVDDLAAEAFGLPVSWDVLSAEQLSADRRMALGSLGRFLHPSHVAFASACERWPSGAWPLAPIGLPLSGGRAWLALRELREVGVRGASALRRSDDLRVTLSVEPLRWPGAAP